MGFSYQYIRGVRGLPSHRSQGVVFVVFGPPKRECHTYQRFWFLGFRDGSIEIDAVDPCLHARLRTAVNKVKISKLAHRMSLY
jgi:hypothetical protein